MAIFKQLGIDLGTANSLVWEIGRGLVLNEPTVVAVSLETDRVLAVGHEAKQMLGRTPDYIIAKKPMRDGVIADYEITEAMLRYFLQKTVGRQLFFKPEVLICVPTGVTQVEQRAVIDAALAAGARRAYLIDEPLAAAIGAQIPIAEPSGNMIVDIGGGTSEAAVISLGGVVSHRSLRVGGNKLDEAIANYLRRKYNLIIGEQTAENLKIKIGRALPSQKEIQLEIHGRSAINGLPQRQQISSNEIVTALQPPLQQILEAIKHVLEETPPELVADIVEKGIILSGGTSQLKALDKYLSGQLGVACRVVDEPQLSVIKGTALVLENLDVYRQSLRE